jgi:hypothetical protein
MRIAALIAIKAYQRYILPYKDFSYVYRLSLSIFSPTLHLSLRIIMKALVLTSIVFVLVGCTTVSTPIPVGYTGPVVPLADTGTKEDGGKARFFSALQIDGKDIKNSLNETRSASYGQGSALNLKYTTRNVPVQAMKVKLIGTHQTAAPIREIASRMAGTFFSVDGTVDFKPVEGKRYEVTGELKKERSCVWIVDVETKAEATDKICSK